MSHGNQQTDSLSLLSEYEKLDIRDKNAKRTYSNQIRKKVTFFIKVAKSIKVRV